VFVAFTYGRKPALWVLANTIQCVLSESSANRKLSKPPNGGNGLGWRYIAIALIDVELARTSKRYNAITSRGRRVYLQPKGATLVDERELQESRRLGGKPGESAPTVDPHDVKTVWEIGRDAHADHPGGGLFIGAELMKRACKPGADIQAVSYRAMLLGLIIQLASEHLTPFIRDGQPDDAVFRAAAIVPAEWMGVGIQRQGPPFDVNEFLRLCKRTET
jgi:hypothetical protein